MHGLVTRSIQCFVTDTYGSETWQGIVADADSGIENFEALLSYDPQITEAILSAASARLGSPRDMFLEDLGTYLVSHPNMVVPRRLLRFGGDSFLEFMFSLDELRDRVRMAIPEMSFPTLEVLDHSTRAYTLLISHPQKGFGHVFVGVLRAMADDYGALVLMEHCGHRDGIETVSIELIDDAFSQGRDFALAVVG